MAKLTLLHTPCTPTDSKASCYSNLWHPRLHVLYKYYLIGNCTVIIIVLGNIMVTTCRSSGTFVKPYYRYTWLFYLSSDAPALSRVFYFMNSMKYINIIIDCSALFMDWQNPDRKKEIEDFCSWANWPKLYCRVLMNVLSCLTRICSSKCIYVEKKCLF